MKKKKLVTSFLIGFTFLGTLPVNLFADELSDIQTKEKTAQDKSNQLNDEITKALAQVDAKTKSIEDLADQINQATNEIKNKEKEIQDSKVKLEKRRAAVGKRLKKMQHESSADQSFKILLEADSFSDFISRAVLLNKVQHQDNEKIDSLVSEQERVAELLGDFKETKDQLESNKKQIVKSRNEVAAEVKSLQKKYASNEAVVKELKAQKNKIEAEKAAERAAEKERKRQEAAAQKKAEAGSLGAVSTPVKNPGSSSKPQGNISGNASISLDQFLFQGVVFSGGYKFTYYSQSVLPGGGLVIPGRHVNAAGYVADGDGYIVAAGSMAKGTVIATPFGAPAKIYDRGTFGNHIDIYIR